VGHRPVARPDVLLGVTGGIAAYRAAELCRLLVKDGLAVQVVMTPAAERFIGETTFAGLSRTPVLTDRPAPGGPIYPHLDAARAARVMVVAPCSANTLAKLAQGLADNVLTESALALAGRLVVAPAMNVRMWEHPATQAAVALLRERGAVIVGPEPGELAEGEVGMGRLAQPETIHAAVAALLRPRGPLAGRSVLVTAGGTREPLDPVRFLGNRSSGRMGVALADAALLRGAEVTTLLCNASVSPAGGIVVATPTAADLEREALARAAAVDVVLMAAAVADYRPAEVGGEKRPRSGHWSLELVPSADILAAIGAARRPGQVLVGFAAETGDGLERARAKRERKGVDLIVLNDVARPDIGFEVDDNEVVLVGPDGAEHLDKAPKAVVAGAILDRVERLLDGPGPSSR
jgi:phosphopantothenoylcysteine decarboxylase/phosphopantothenate--cysteine ligase